jgi:Zn-dependent protease
MKCEHPYCDADEDVLFYCRYCRGSFCVHHRDSEFHNCVPQTTGAQSGDQSTEEFARQVFASAARTTQRVASQAQAQAPPVSFPDEKSKKKFIEQQLIARRDLFSLGNEVLDLVAGFALIVLVFGIFQYIIRDENKWWGFLIAALLVGTAFLPHELAHKLVAERRGQFARYILWVRGIMFTLITLIFGIGLIVPGFVAIVPMSKQMDKKDTGLVSFAGPATNAVIGFVSLLIGVLTYTGIIPFGGVLAAPNIFILIAQFNALIALFNCIPVWQLDGAKIFKWNKIVYFVLVAINIAIAVPTFILNPGFLTPG